MNATGDIVITEFRHAREFRAIRFAAELASGGTPVGRVSVTANRWAPFKVEGSSFLHGMEFTIRGSNNKLQVIDKALNIECGVYLRPGFRRWYLKSATIVCRDVVVQVEYGFFEVRFRKEPAIDGSPVSFGTRIRFLECNIPVFSCEIEWLALRESWAVLVAMLSLLIWQPMFTPD